MFYTVKFLNSPTCTADCVTIGCQKFAGLLPVKLRETLLLLFPAAYSRWFACSAWQPPAFMPSMEVLPK